MMNQVFKRSVRRLCILLSTVLLTLMFGLPSAVFAAAPVNKMDKVDISTASGSPVVMITTENPVGYRYTVYDSIDPVRVVVDFPGMDVDAVDAPEVNDAGVVSDVKISSFDLTSGKLGRLEVILSRSAAYDVSLTDNVFTMTFSDSVEPSAAAVQAEPEPLAKTDAEPEVPEESEDIKIASPEPEPVPVNSESAVSSASSSPASVVTGVSVNDSSLSINADGRIEIFKYFKLGAPARLVVDVYGVKAGFKERKFNLGNGFKQMRVGAYKDKARFVLDAVDTLPEYTVVTQDNSVAVAWGDAVGEDVPVSSSSVVSGVPVNIEAVDFDIEGNESVVRVTLSNSANIIEPTVKDDIVGFGVRNATISRALRRAVDASSFPSSIRLVTPYTVLVGDSQDVRFAVELKGPSEYELDQSGNVVTLRVVNGPFAEPEALKDSTIAVAVEESSAGQEDMAGSDAESSETAESTEISNAEVSNIVDESVMGSVTEDEVSAADMAGSDVPVKSRTVSTTAENIYAGQRISLVFDKANIRNILQLIAEVSNLNILAGDGVDGTITLRLIDVPWDQALDLILETNDLGMIRDGNVARILPKESIRAMDEAKFTADRTKEKLENLVTEVITVSYTDLGNISKPSRELLTDRGKITEDSRNKQLIVTDIPKIIEEVRNLVSILDTPEKQVLIEARIVEVSTTANLDLGINWGFAYSQDASFSVPHQGTSTQESGLGLGGNFVVPAFAAGLGQTAGIGGEFSWGRVGFDTTILDLRLGALETAGEGQVISNPRIMTLNGEKAKISQGTMIPYQTVSSSEIKTELVEAALSLEVTPVINPDGSVILEIKATNSTPGSTVATGAGAAPSIDTKEAETKMLVMDSETMVIGGIYVEKDDYSENGVPLLMDIPLIGHLFKSTKTNKNRTELMIFITPRIIE